MEELELLTEEYTKQENPGSKPGSLKLKAAMYLGKANGEELGSTDLKRLRAKANKMKKSSRKAERDKGNKLYKQVMVVYNMDNASE